MFAKWFKKPAAPTATESKSSTPLDTGAEPQRPTVPVELVVTNPELQKFLALSKNAPFKLTHNLLAVIDKSRNAHIFDLVEKADNVHIFDLVKNADADPLIQKNFTKFYQAIDCKLDQLRASKYYCVGTADDKLRQKKVLRVLDLADLTKYSEKVIRVGSGIFESEDIDIQFFPDQKSIVVMIYSRFTEKKIIYFVNIETEQIFQIYRDKSNTLNCFTILDDKNILIIDSETGYGRITIDPHTQTTSFLQCYDPAHKQGSRKNVSQLISLGNNVFVEMIAYPFTNPVFKLECHAIDAKGYITTFGTGTTSKLLPEGVFVDQRKNAVMLIDPINKQLIHTTECLTNGNEIFSCYSHTVAIPINNNINVLAIPEFISHELINKELDPHIASPDIRNLILEYLPKSKLSKEDEEKQLDIDRLFFEISKWPSSGSVVNAITYYFSRDENEQKDPSPINVLRAINSYLSVPLVNIINITSETDILSVLQNQIKKMNAIGGYIDGILNEDKKKHFGKLSKEDKERYESQGQAFGLLMTLMAEAIAELSQGRDPKTAVEELTEKLRNERDRKASDKDGKKYDLESLDFKYYKTLSKLDELLAKYDELTKSKTHERKADRPKRG